MEETHNFFDPARAVDPDATLVSEHDPTLATPRFDAGEAHEARPVVPLTANPVNRARRRWPVVLVLVSALAGGAISIFAFRVYQQRQATRVAGQPQQEVTQAAQQQQPQSPTPAPSPVMSATGTTEEKPQQQRPVIIETVETEKASAPPKRDESAAHKVATAEETKTARKAERKVEEKRAEHSSSGETRPRIVDTSREPRRADEDMRQDDRADDSADARRDGWQARRRERRERRRSNSGGGQRRNIDRIKDIFQGPPPA